MMASPSPMRASFPCLLAICFAISSLTTRAATIAHWNFNALSTASAATPGSGTVPTTLSASLGSGTLVLSSWAGTVDDFAGSSLNAQPGDAAGASLSLIAASGSPYPGNGSSILLEFSMLQWRDPVLSFATQGTATGFNSNQVAWSLNGSDFTDFGAAYSPSASYSLQSFDLSAVDSLDGAATAYLRITFDGATGASGNNRIDNLTLSAIPEPSILCLLPGGAGMLLLRRRRRKTATVIDRRYIQP